jgi:uncharacterized protein YegL
VKKTLLLFLVTATFVLTMILFASKLYAYKPSFKYADVGQRAGVLVVIDVSGSMSGYPIQAVRGVLKQTMAKMPKNSAAGLISFSGCNKSDIILEVPFADNNMQQVVERADALSIRGGTDIYGALVMAEKEVQKIGGRYCSTVLLLSDGDDTCGLGPVKEVVKKMIDTNEKCNKVSTITIGVPEWEGKLFDEISEAGKGKHTNVDSIEEMEKAVQEELAANLEEAKEVGGWDGDYSGMNKDNKDTDGKKDKGGKKNDSPTNPKGPDPLTIEQEVQKEKKK